MSEYIRTNKVDPNECPNIFVQTRLTWMNVRINIHAQYIRIFEYIRHTLLWFRLSVSDWLTRFSAKAFNPVYIQKAKGPQKCMCTSDLVSKNGWYFSHVNAAKQDISNDKTPVWCPDYLKLAKIIIIIIFTRFALEVWEITVGDPGTLQELVPQTSSDLKFITFFQIGVRVTYL